MAVSSKALPPTVSCLSLLPRFESRPEYVRKSPVTEVRWWFSTCTPVPFTTFNWLVTTLLLYGRESDDN